MSQPRRILRSLAAATLAALLPASSARAGWTAGFVAVPELSEHAPSAAPIGNSRSDELRLFAVTRALVSSQPGLAERRFKRVVGQPLQGWASWIHRGKPAGAPDPAQWRRFLPVTSMHPYLGKDVFGLFDFPDGSATEKIGIAHLSSTTTGNPPYATIFGWAPTQNPPGGISPELFNPQTIASTVSEFDVFGTNSDDGRPSIAGRTELLRLHAHQTGGAWSYGHAENLGQPSIAKVRANVALGPNSTASAPLGVPSAPRHFVFVKAAVADHDRVTFAMGNATGGMFTWGIDLGSPTMERIVDGPLAVVWSGSACTFGCPVFSRIGIWVTTFNRKTDRFELHERHFDAYTNTMSDPMQPGQWSPWQSFGGPPGLDSHTKFRMTSGLVWYEGSTQKINLFGYTDSDPDSSLPERLVDFFWDGGAWRWGSAPSTPPSGAGFRTMSSTVLQSPLVPPRTYVRLSVFGRTSGTADPGATDVGHIWERYYVIENGVHTGWAWKDLSYECVRDGQPPFCTGR
jgi:hypothetical protein